MSLLKNLKALRGKITSLLPFGPHQSLAIFQANNPGIIKVSFICQLLVGPGGGTANQGRCVTQQGFNLAQQCPVSRISSGNQCVPDKALTAAAFDRGFAKELPEPGIIQAQQF